MSVGNLISPSEVAASGRQAFLLGDRVCMRGERDGVTAADLDEQFADAMIATGQALVLNITDRLICRRVCAARADWDLLSREASAVDLLNHFDLLDWCALALAADLLLL